MTHILLRHREIPDINKIDCLQKERRFCCFQKCRDKNETQRSDRRGQEFQFARTRRRGFPNWHEVVVH